MPPSETSSIYATNHRSFQVNTAARSGFPDALEHLANFRFRRAPGVNLADFVQHMQLLARVANAIALQLDIKNGAVDPETVVSELLRMGDFTPQEVIDIDFNALRSTVAKIKDLKSQLHTNTEIGELENRLKLMGQTREPVKKFLDMDSLPGKQECLKSITEIEQTTLDASEINNFKSYFETTAKLIDAFPELKSDKDQSKLVTEKVNVLTPLKGNLDILYAVKFDEMFAVFEKISKIVVNTTFLRLLVEEETIHRSYKVAVAPSLTNMNEAGQNFAKFQQLAVAFKNSRNTLDKMKTLILARKYSSDRKLESTVGFPDGWKDFERLKSDVQTDWVKKQATANLELSTALTNAFSTLKSLETELEVLDKDWDSKLTSNDEVSNVLSREIRIADNSDIDFSTVAATLFACKKNQMATLPSSEWEKVSNDMNSIDVLKTLTSLKKFKEMMNNFQELADSLKDMDTYTNDDEKVKKGLAIVESVKKPQGKTAEALRNFHQIYQDVKVLDAFAKDYEAKKNAIVAKKDTLESYITEVKNSKAPEFYSCLVNTSNSEQFGAIIDDFLATRDGQLSSQADSAVKTIDLLEASVASLKNLQTACQSIKNVDEVTVAGLSSLSNSKDVSDKLGKAVQGLANIKKADESRSLLQPLLDNADIIKHNAISSLKQLSFDDYQNLRTFEDLKNSLDKMYSEIDIMKSKLDTISDTVLSSNDVGFTAAANVPDVSVDVEKLKNSLTALIAALTATSTDKQALTDAKTALTTLADLDLEFSNYNIGSGSTVLGPLESFLQKFFPQPPAAPAPNAPSQPGPPQSGEPQNQAGSPQGQPVAGQQPLGIEKDANSEGGSGLTIVIVILCIFVLGAAGGAVYWFFLRKKKEKKEKKEEKEDAVVAPPVVFQKLPDEDVFAAIFEYNKMLIERMDNGNFSPCGYLTKFLKSFDNNMQIQTSGKAHITERRDDSMFCKEKTAVTVTGFEDNFIHANYMMFGDVMYIMSQAPLRGKEVGRQSIKISTIEKHWAMIEQKKVAIVAQLCNFMEDYFERCPKYYPETKGETMTHGRYTITCVDLIDISNKFNVGREDLEKTSLVRLEYTNSLDKSKNQVDILRYFNWPESASPKDPMVGLEILRFLDSYKKNVLVHCSSGIGRTCSLVGIKKGMEMARPPNMKPGDRTGVVQIISALRDCRVGAIQTAQQMSYMLISLTKGLMEAQRVKFLMEYEELYFDHEIINDPRKQDKYTIMASGRDGVLMFIDLYRKDEYKKEREAYGQMKKAEYEKTKTSESVQGGERIDEKLSGTV